MYIHTPSLQHLLPRLETLTSSKKISSHFSSEEAQATLFCRVGTASEDQLTFPSQKRVGKVWEGPVGLAKDSWADSSPQQAQRKQETKAIFCSPHSQGTNLNGLLYNPLEIMSILREGEAKQAKTALGLTGVTLPGRASLKLNSQARAAPSPASFLPQPPPSSHKSVSIHPPLYPEKEGLVKKDLGLAT
jgi:hypothetical protein